MAANTLRPGQVIERSGIYRDLVSASAQRSFRARQRPQRPNVAVYGVRLWTPIRVNRTALPTSGNGTAG